MARFAVINNGTVINTIEADSKAIAEEISGFECIESDTVGIGTAYINGNFEIEEVEEYDPMAQEEGRLHTATDLTPEEQALKDSLIAGLSEQDRNPR